MVLAAVSFVAMLLLFADFTGAAHAWLGWLADVQLVPALMAGSVVALVVVAVLTLLFGRVYCSVICPLGILQDVIWSRHKPRQSYSAPLTWLRYVVLLLFILALVAGVGVVTATLDPYSTFGMMASNLFAPIYRGANNVLAWAAERADSYAFYATEVWVRSVVALALSVVFLIIIGVLAWRGGRTYCNTICPVGTVLGILSRFALLRVVIDADKCNKCGNCARHCKASCIDSQNHSVDYTRCVDCMDCLEVCHKRAISYKMAGWGSTKGLKPIDPSRREALAIGGALIATQSMAKMKKTTDGGLAYIADKKVPERNAPIVPAGAMSLGHMTAKCVQCQLCVSACPNGVLRPSTDLATFMVPVMSYERGYCRPECTRCADVCPADAIKPITVAEKSSTQIGHAKWIKENCVALIDDVHCNACASHCPCGAIEMMPVNPDDPSSRHTPVVDESRCIGCGACEHLCPARPFSALVVHGHEVHKKV